MFDDFSTGSFIVISLVTLVVAMSVTSLLLARNRSRGTERAMAVEGVLARSMVNGGNGATWGDAATGAVMSAEVDAATPSGTPTTTASTTGLAIAGVSRAPATGEAPRAPGRDPLTGLLDADAFERALGDEEARVARYRRPATVVVFELDGLDRLVARLGPDAGDRVVPALADAIHRLARRADHVGRLGPGRFAALLPETDEVAAINYVERVRRACEMWLESGAIAMQLAIGWAGTNGGTSLTSAMVEATDRMLVEHRRNVRRDDLAGADGDATTAAAPGGAPGADGADGATSADGGSAS